MDINLSEKNFYLGLAKFNGQNEYVKNFTLYEVNPNTGSIAGGQVVTLTGQKKRVFLKKVL